MSDPAVNLPLSDSAALAGATNQSVRLSPLAAEVATLFDRYRSPLLRYLQSFGMTPHDGEEVVQEVFLALYQHLSAGRPRTNLAGWLFRVAHNQGLKRCMANQRMATGTAEDGIDVLERADPAPDPEQQVHAKQRQQRLLAVVDALPENRPARPVPARRRLALSRDCRGPGDLSRRRGAVLGTVGRKVVTGRRAGIDESA